MLISGAFGVAVIVLGDSLFERDWDDALLAGALFAVLAACAFWWRRRRGRTLG
jgi:hypothetical protein